MIKVSDYIAKRLKEHGIDHFFMVSGGGAMHLNDSLGHALPYTANHHEQACGIAAEGYARVNQKLAAVNVTTGPGGLNCLNCLMGHWTDSVPVIYISGQVKFTTTIASCPEIPLRQLGDQEVDIISCVRPLTKYAVMVTEPLDIKYHIDRAIYKATTGRFGPVWLDIPMNVQGAQVDEAMLREFTVPQADRPVVDAASILQKMAEAKRPLIVGGHGLRIAGQVEAFRQLAEKLRLPVVTTFNGMDVMPTDHPNFAGRIGTVGQRAGNFVLQNADVILFLGTRNNIRQVSYNWENYAPKAYKMVVDIDPAELAKPTLTPDMPICADLADVVPALLAKAEPVERPEWLAYCRRMNERYSFANTPEYRQEGEGINVYYFLHELGNALAEDDIIVAGNGSACVCTHQVFPIKKKQRQFYNSGDASMGFDLPAAIGAYYQAGNRRVICLTGDGSIMMNLQELETISHNKLPIKIFMMNNGGYSSIRQTQRNFFAGRMTGCGADSGVGMPDFMKLADGFSIPGVRLSDPQTLTQDISNVLAMDGPVFCEIMLKQEYSFIPKLSARKLDDGTMISPSLEDMFPFIDREEYQENMLQ